LDAFCLAVALMHAVAAGPAGLNNALSDTPH
jgi:hypothetical protein